MSSDASSFPPQPPQPPQQPVRSGIPAWVIVLIVVSVLFFMLMVCGVLTALLLPAIQAAREAARRNACMNHVRQIEIALQNYHDEHGSFPPAYLADENGQPMHSWRALLLPYLDENLARQYNFDEPWDGPTNSRLAQQAPDVYRCPSEAAADAATTSYVAIVGPETIWTGPEGTRIRQIADGTSKTIAIVEGAGSGIHWLEPRDLSFEEAMQGINRGNQPGIASHHAGGVVAAGFCDGHVEFLDDDTDPQLLRALLTKDGREQIQYSE